ncbi:MAG: flavin reductase [Butyrivibrio sp.]|nr:flavin reductase [Butyrivibrio sp.]
MRVFQPIDPAQLDEGAFNFSGKSMLITAANESKANTMTASWGGVGYLWNRRVVFIFVRGSRYTREFLDSSDEFSLSFFNNSDKFRGALKYLGAVSGRDEDKIANARLNVGYDEGIPYIEEADNIITCKVLYRQEFEKQGFIDLDIIDDVYKDDDYHIMYVGEIKKVMIR